MSHTPRPEPPLTHGQEEAVSTQIALIQRIAERLTGAVGLDAVADVVASDVRDGVGASALTLAVLSDDRATFTAHAVEGVPAPTTRGMNGQVPIDSWLPASAVVHHGRPLFWPSLSARDRQYPEYVGHRSIAASWAVLPLVVQGTVIGVLAIGWPVERAFTDADKALLQGIAHQCAVALDRARIDLERKAEQDTLKLLSEGTRIMVSSLQPKRVLERFVDLAVPRLAPWCAVYVADRHSLRRVAIRIEGDKQLARELEGRSTVSLGEPLPLTTTYATGQPQVFHVDDAVIRAVYPEAQAERILRRSASWTGVNVPVTAAGKPIGVLSLISSAWQGAPPKEVVVAAEGLAARAGVALVNAQRYQDERNTAAMLMQAFLPAELPEIPGYEVAAQYLPTGSRVAGDWYDVLHLPSGRYLVGIGDAGGHGIEAASLMGQLRNCARGLAMTGQPPATILDALHLVTAESGADSFATAAYGSFDPGNHSVTWASAGHLPRLEFADGHACFLPEAPTAPLGCPSPPATERTGVCPPGHGIVLVTDGVVERRSSDLGVGMERLRRLVAAHASMHAWELTQLIADELCQDPEDDCCVVVLRRA